MMKKPIINPDHELYPSVTYAATAARVADRILDQYGLPSNGHEVAGPFSLLAFAEHCPFIQDAMDKAAPRERGLHHNTALDATAEAVIASLSEPDSRRLREIVFHECVLQNDSTMDVIPMEVEVTNVNVTLNGQYLRMDWAEWEDALQNYANTMTEFLAADRLVEHDLGNGVMLQIHFNLNRRDDRVIATGTGTIASKASGDQSHVLFQADLTIHATADAAQQGLLAATAEA